MATQDSTFLSSTLVSLISRCSAYAAAVSTADTTHTWCATPSATLEAQYSASSEAVAGAAAASASGMHSAARVCAGATAAASHDAATPPPKAALHRHACDRLTARNGMWAVG